MVGFVGSVGVILKLFDSIKLCILESYTSVGRMTRVLPLSAVVTCIVSFELGAYAFNSIGFVLCFLCGGWWLFLCRLVMRSTISFLYTSRSDVGNYDTAISASTAKFSNQFLRFVWRLYLSPLCNRAISGSVNGMLMSFIPCGQKSCVCHGIFVCVWVSLLIFMSSFLYFVCISRCSCLSIMLWMCGQVLSQILARTRCK